MWVIKARETSSSWSAAKSAAKVPTGPIPISRRASSGYPALNLELLSSIKRLAR